MDHHFSKPHLPLISQRILFERKTLPPRPKITQRLNLGQRIRRADRVRFAATTLRAKSKEPASRNASRASTPLGAQDSLSDLSDLTEGEDENSEDEEDELESVGSSALIAKPPGAIGRKSGGYNLEEALDWEEGRYKRMIAWINIKIKESLDGEKSFKYQDTKILNKVISEGVQKFEIEGMYENNWPIREGLKMRLKTMSESAKRKGKGNTEKKIKKALADVISNA